jgi:hypothetical protein
LEWLAAMCAHGPNKGEQRVRYYGHYSNVARGKRKKAGVDDAIGAILNPQSSDKDRRRQWAQLIQKIYAVDPLLCPRCAGPMRVVAFTEQADVIRKILKHLDMWDVKRKPAPRAHGPPTATALQDIDGVIPSAETLLTDIDDPDIPVGESIRTFMHAHGYGCRSTAMEPFNQLPIQATTNAIAA